MNLLFDVRSLRIVIEVNMRKPTRPRKGKILASTTTDNRTYKIASRRFKGEGICKKCQPGTGCNHPRNWK